MAWREWIRTVEVVPALDAGDVAALQPAVDALLRTGCRIFHVHVRGESDADAITEMKIMARRYDGVVDVHVRDADPAASFARLAAAGADSVTFDAHAAADPASTIRAARECEVQVGVAFRVDIEPEEIAATASDADLVLCACEGSHVVEHVRRVASLLPDRVEVQVEGGVSHDNLRSLSRAGARLLVADRPIFDREDLPRAYRRLVQALA
ncbi:MAG: hypothetical protein JO186_05995 [Actinobacteria bacterium]|nr:hypothetical protein [Actinomycetota bacterium]MBV8598874.1 hypothetical protein [Actinomycetota bacterium]